MAWELGPHLHQRGQLLSPIQIIPLAPHIQGFSKVAEDLATLSWKQTIYSANVPCLRGTSSWHRLEKDVVPKVGQSIVYYRSTFWRKRKKLFVDINRESDISFLFVDPCIGKQKHREPQKSHKGHKIYSPEKQNMISRAVPSEHLNNWRYNWLPGLQYRASSSLYTSPFFCQPEMPFWNVDLKPKAN